MAPRQGAEPRSRARGTALADGGPPGDVSRPGVIADRIVDAILAGRLAPGQRLGEQEIGRAHV